MPHEMTAALTLLLALTSANSMLWIALRLERVAAGKRADNLYESMRGLRDDVRELRRVVEERLQSVEALMRGRNAGRAPGAAGGIA